LGRTVNYISCVFIGYKNVFGPKETCFFLLYDLIIKIVNFHGRSGKLWTIKRILSTYNVCDLVSSTVWKFIHSICCKMSVVWHYCQRFSLHCWEKFFNDHLRIDTKRFPISVKWNSYVHADWMNKFPNRGRYQINNRKS
jgi:hypothetical protein